VKELQAIDYTVKYDSILVLYNILIISFEGQN